jgi:hypothetical protein
MPGSPASSMTVPRPAKALSSASPSCAISRSRPTSGPPAR